MILWNSVQTSKEIRTYLTIVNIKNGRHVISRSEKKSEHIVLVYNAHPYKIIWTKSHPLCIRNYGTKFFQNIYYFELLVNQFR